MQTTVVVCPGVHPPDLTQQFMRSLQGVNVPTDQWLVFPAERYPAYDSLQVLRFIHETQSQQGATAGANSPLLFIGFSAGVVGALGAACALENLGRTVKALFAIDGWGVPLWGGFPSHRLSHDAFTHWSSSLLGAGCDRFYADPPVEHLELWRSPHTIHGQQVPSAAPQTPIKTTAGLYLAQWLRTYQAV